MRTVTAAIQAEGRHPIREVTRATVQVNSTIAATTTSCNVLTQMDEVYWLESDTKV